MWKALRAQGIFRGHGPAPKVAFLYTGQGSQYVNMLRPLYTRGADCGRDFCRSQSRDDSPARQASHGICFRRRRPTRNAVAKADDDLRQTAITQPAVLAIDLALTRLLAAYGVQPDMTMGHSLGEYGALVASGALPFEDALEAVSARGRGMTRVAVADKGKMAAVFAPLEEIERILKTVNGYVVIANINSEHQAVIGGASEAVTQAMGVLQKAGYEVSELPVSHAFHTSIVAPASEPLRKELERLHLESPRVPIVANVNGEFYPTGPDVVPQMLDLLAEASRVSRAIRQRPAHTLRGGRAHLRGSWAEESAAGIRRRCPRRPRRCGFALYQSSEVRRHRIVQPGVVRPLCGGTGPRDSLQSQPKSQRHPSRSHLRSERLHRSRWRLLPPAASTAQSPTNGDHFAELGHFFADVLERGWQMQREGKIVPRQRSGGDHRRCAGSARNRAHLRRCQSGAHPARRSIHRSHPHDACARPCSTSTSRAW